jgi:putative ABC transport system substrate-binding protein
MTGPRLAFTMALLLFVGLFSPIAVRPQESRKAARIGWLGGNPAGGPHLREAFLQGLRDLGYVEGRDFLIEYRYAGARGERLPALAAELVALKVDLIFASGGTSGALAAKQATQTIPIVFVAASDPVASGLVASVARPGGNVTGLSFLFSTDLVTKGMELLTQAVPKSAASLSSWRRAIWPHNKPRPCGAPPKARRGASGCGFTSSRRGGPTISRGRSRKSPEPVRML